MLNKVVFRIQYLSNYHDILVDSSRHNYGRDSPACLFGTNSFCLGFFRGTHHFLLELVLLSDGYTQNRQNLLSESV